MEYRKDIDILRAVAVLLVVVFHADKTFLTGGFVGVDVFFVISGFLITSIIYPQICARKFSFVAFFIKRAKRLLPASLVMTFVTLIAFAYIYPANLFQNVVEAGLSSLVFMSNLYFWQTSGYFAASNELQPFLHTWSLSLEEQFYIVWPLLLVLCRSLSLQLRFGLMLVGLFTSIALSTLLIPNAESFIGYYVLPTRFYELGIGALAAIYLLETKQQYLWSKNKITKDLGLLLILGSALLLSPASAFPGYLALLPVCGALLYIGSQHAGPLSKAINNGPILFIGLISYSLYLWHWPIITIIKWLITEPSWLHYSLYSLSSLGLAYLSYRFIETPFRHAKWQIKTVTVGFVCSMALTLSLLITKNYWISPVDQAIHTQYASIKQYPYAHRRCIDQARDEGQWSPCEVTRSQNNAPHVFVWGDSHAGALMGVFEHINSPLNITVSLHSGCASLPSVMRNNRVDCTAINEQVYEHIKATPYDLILHVSAWNNYKVENQLSFDEYSEPNKVYAAAISELLNTYAELNINYAFVAQPPIFAFDAPDLFFKSHLGKSTIEHLPVTAFSEQQVDFAATSLSTEELYRFDQYICSNTNCVPAIEAQLMYMDKDHISRNYTALISDSFHAFMTKQLQQNNTAMVSTQGHRKEADE